MGQLYKYRIIIITLLFAAVGLIIAWLLKTNELQRYYYYLTPILALLVSFLFSLLLKGRRFLSTQKGYKLFAAVLFVLFIAALFYHIKSYRNSTFAYSDLYGSTKSYVKGTVYTKDALDYKKEHPYLGTADSTLLFDGFGGPDGKAEVWTQASIDKNIFLLAASYGLVIFLAAAFVSLLTEATLEKSIQKQVAEALLDANAKSNYNAYISSYSKKQSDKAYAAIKFHIFLSYSSEQHTEAESIYYSLLNNGHMAFFDRDTLPKGMEYDTAIRTAINNSDLMIFLISPTSVTAPHYTITELKFARERWQSANKHLLPVMVIDTPYDVIPAFVKSVTVFKAEGNLTAEVIAAVEADYLENHSNH